MQTTTLRISVEARDTLARIAADEFGGLSLDEALRIVLFQHQTAVAVARLEADAEALADYQREAQEWAELDVRVEGVKVGRVAPWQVWWCEFDPQVGTEQAGRRPAIVVGTGLACSLPNRLALVVPCTSTNREAPWQPRVVLAGRTGYAMCDQVKALSVNRLVSRHQAGRVSEAERDAIRFALRQLVDVG